MRRIGDECGLPLTFLLLCAAWSLVLVPAAGRADDETETVVVSGVGTTQDAALRNALSNAVQQAVGVVVDSETVVQNNKLIRDSILTYSNAYVERFEKLDETSSSGITELNIRAVVRKRQLVAKLKELNVTTKRLEGPSLFGKVVTQLEEEKGAASLVGRALQDYPIAYLTANVVGEPEVVEKTAERVVIRLAIELGVQKERYEAFVQGLVPVLEQVATWKDSVNTRSQRWDGGDVSSYFFQNRMASAFQIPLQEVSGDRQAPWGLLFWAARDVVKRSTPSNALTSDSLPSGIVVVSRLNSAADNLSWRAFGVSRDAAIEAIKAVRTSLSVHVAIVDVKGDEIWGGDEVLRSYDEPNGAMCVRLGTLSVPQCLGQWSMLTLGILSEKGGWITLTPFPLLGHPGNLPVYASKARFPVDVRMSLDEIKRMATVRCELHGARAALPVLPKDR